MFRKPKPQEAITLKNLTCNDLRHSSIQEERQLAEELYEIIPTRQISHFVEMNADKLPVGGAGEFVGYFIDFKPGFELVSVTFEFLKVEITHKKLSFWFEGILYSFGTSRQSIEDYERSGFKFGNLKDSFDFLAIETMFLKITRVAEAFIMSELKAKET